MLSLLNRRDYLAGAFALAAGTSLPSSFAQSKPQEPKWPAKPIRIVVSFAPGGLTDAYARLYAEQLTTQLGVAAVVENKPGAGGIIAIDHVVKSPADGYTLLMTTSGTVGQNRVLYSKLPYNLDKDLGIVTNFPSGPLVVGISDKVPAKNMHEFIEFAKQNRTTMGTYAPGSYPHMVADQTNKAHGTQILSAHYRGESPMWIDVASNQIQIAIGSYQAFSTVQARGVRPIGVTGTYRSPKLPDVPTLAEQGISGSLVTLEGGLPLMVPTGTPEVVQRILSKVAVDGAQTEKAAQLRTSFAIPNKPKNLTQTRLEWERDVPIWVKIAVDLGIKLD